MDAPTGTSTDTETDTDVVVVGAGPTGLLLAGDLASAGVRTVVVDRRPATLSNLTRAFAVHARTLEVLDARGLADDLLVTGRRVTTVRLFDRIEVHLDALASRFPFVLVTPQYEVERLLRRRAQDAGVVFRHDTRVTDLAQDSGGVTLTTVPGAGAADAAATEDAAASGAPTTTLRARWVVGADGVRSTVRDTVGIPFPGETVIRAMILADVRLATPPPDVLTVATARGSLGFVAPFGDGWYRFIGWAGEERTDRPVTLDEVRAVARATLGDDLGMHDLRFADRFAADERQAPTYRAGRVLLAGDAAHAHSPAGGLGMNTGLQDAANLSWRLAAVVRGAPPALLDGYASERHPVGRQVLRASGTILRLATRPGPLVAAARQVLTTALSHVPAARRRAAGMISALGVAYDAPPGAHPRAGSRVPDLPLDGGPAGSRLAEALRAGRFVLVLPADASDVSAAGLPASDGETDVADRVVVRRADHRPATLLVRPDGYLADARVP
ncbi:FAD-dependent monooxygenase [Isoptericola cucumis]|uniref:FAD-dependent oxidoreductase n=1 Tax=Isoptericola cucumis TaxID=1776856 RepID=A0ABQ2B493_9MICO|nr:FAD-dependent monooxygenase [Isoptericola cucumis]GGI07440.1 FAD-dependent oxidoreductase [Isoptericola cucumis]